MNTPINHIEILGKLTTSSQTKKSVFWGALVLLLMGGSVFAASGSANWNASPTNGTWQVTTQNNWSTGVGNFPGSTTAQIADTATFNQTSTTTTITTGTLFLGAVVYNTAAASPYNLTGGTITFRDGTTSIVTMNATVANDQLISSNIKLGTAVASNSTITNSSTTNSLTISGTITGGTGGTAAAKTLTLAGAGSIILSGAVTKGGGSTIVLQNNNTGTVSLTNAGTLLNQLFLSGANGVLDIGSGTLRVSNAGGTTLQSTQNYSINASAGGAIALQVSDGDWGASNGTTLTINAPITGAFRFELFTAAPATAGGVMFLANANNSFTGGVQINNSILKVLSIGEPGTNSPLGTGNPILVAAATLRYAGTTDETTTKTIALNGATPALEVADTGNLTISSNLTSPNAGAKTLTLLGSSTGIGRIDGIIPNNTAATSLTKQGTGTWILGGANTYTGTTTVNGGTLQLSNSSGSATGSGSVVVNSGGTLSVQTTGTAATAGAVTVNGHTTVPGILVLANGAFLNGGLTLATGSAGTFSTGSNLNPGGAATAATVTINNAELNTQAFSNLSYDLNTATTIGSGVNDLILTNTTPVADGPTRININTLGVLNTGDTYTLISGYSGKIDDTSFSNIALNTVFTGVDTGHSGLLINDFGQLLLKIIPASPSGSIFWSGAVDANWETLTPGTNWSTTSTPITDPLALPGASSDVHFYTSSPLGTNLNTTIGNYFSINSLTFDGGALSSDVSINGGSLAVNNAAGVSVASGAGNISVSSNVVLGASQTWTNNSSNLLSVSGAVANGSSTLTIDGTGNVTINGVIGSGSGGLIKSSTTNTLVLGGANTYTGNTTFGGGTVRYTLDNLGVKTLQLGLSNGSTNITSLDLSTNPSSLTVTALNVVTNTTTENTITIGAGKTLSSTGGMTIGYQANSGTSTTTKLTVSGAGGMSITGTTLAVSVDGAAPANSTWTNKAFLDVSGLASFSANVTNFNVGVGANTQGPGTVTLSDLGDGTNTILATTLTIGDTGTNNGGGLSTLTLGAGTVTNPVTNVIQADTINIGRGKSSGNGTMKFASQTAGSPGSLTIANKAGTGGSNITVANINAAGTGGGAVGTLDLRGHVTTVNANTVIICNTNNTTLAGGTTGTISFDTGTFTAATLNMAVVSSGSSTNNTNATLNIGGGDFTVSGTTTVVNNSSNTAATNVPATGTINLSGGTLTLSTLNTAVKSGAGIGSSTANINVSGTGSMTVNTAFSMGNRGAAGSSTANLNITGSGLVTSNANIVEGGGTVTSTITLNGTGAILDMTGHDIGVTGTGIDTFTFADGKLRNLGTCFGGIALGTGTHTFEQVSAVGEIKGVISESSAGLSLTKTGANTLVLSGANTFTGSTDVTAGVLQLNSGGSLAGTAVTVSPGAALIVNASTTIGTSGTATVSVQGAASSGGGTLSLSSGAINSLTLTNTSSGANVLTLGDAANPAKAANLTFDVTTGGANDSIIVSNNGNVVVNQGGCRINVVPLATLSGFPLTYTLIDLSAGTGIIDTTSGGAFSLANAGGYAGSVAVVGGNTLVLTLNAPSAPTPATAFFAGTNDSVWSTLVGATSNWLNATAGTDTNQIPGPITDVTLTANSAANFSSMSLGDNFTINSLTFSGTGTSNTAGLTLNSGLPATNALTINTAAGITVNSGAGNDTINSPVVLSGASQTWTNNEAASNLTVNGSISGAFGLTKAGVGALTLGGANTFTGMTLSAGTLNINNAAALGLTAGTFNISGAGAIIDNTSADMVVNASNNPLALNADFTFTGTKDLNLGTGGVTLGSSRSITVNSGTLTLGGAISGATFGITKAGSGTLVLNGIIGTTTGGLSVTGGILVIGNAANTFTGNMTVDGANSILQMNSGSNGNATSAPLGIFPGGTGYKTITLTNGGGFRPNATYNVNVPSATVQGAGYVFMIGTGGGVIDVPSGVTFTIDDGNAAGTATTAAQLQGSGALTKTGLGILQTDDSTVFAGTITVAAGTLQISGSANSLGFGGSTTIQSGAALNLNGLNMSNAEPLTLTGTGLAALPQGALTSTTGTGTFSGPIMIATGGATIGGGNGALTLNAGATIDLGSNTLTLNQSASRTTTNGVISGTGNVTVTGTGLAGDWANAAEHTYSGLTTLQAGSKTVVGTSSTGVGAGVTSGPFGTGTVVLNGGSLRSGINAPFTIGNTTILSADTTFYTINNEKDLTLAGPMTLSAGTHTLTTEVGNTVPGTFVIISGAIGDNSNNLGLIKAGIGKLVLAGINTYTGPTTVSEGPLQLSGSIASTSLTLAGGTTLDLASGTANPITTLTSLSIGSAATTTTINFELGSNTASSDRITTTGAATVAGNVVINLAQLTGFGAGTYDLITAASGLSAATYSIAAAPGGFTYSLAGSTDSVVRVTVTASLIANTLYWRGAIDNKWGTQNSGMSNWTTDLAGSTNAGVAPSALTDVIFNANNSGSGIITTTLEGQFPISTLTFNALPAGITGVNIAPGAIDTNALVITPPSSASGISIASGGGNANISAAIVLGGNQTWTNSSSNKLTLSGVSISGSGNLTITGTTEFSSTLPQTINGSGSITINNGITFNGSASQTLGRVISGVGSLTYSGSDTLTITSAGSNYTGGTFVNSGTLKLGANNALPASSIVITGTGAGITAGLDVGTFNQTFNALTLGGTTTTSVAQIVGTGTLTLTNGLTFDATNNPSPAQITVSTLDLNAGAQTFDIGNSNATSTTFTPDLRITSALQNGNLVKTGAGDLSLQGGSAFAGTVTVNAGGLQAYCADTGSTAFNALGTASILLTGSNPTLRLTPRVTTAPGGATPGFFFTGYQGAALTSLAAVNFVGASQTITNASGNAAYLNVASTGGTVSTIDTVAAAAGFPATTTFQFIGLLNISTEGRYVFTSAQDDFSNLFVDGNLIIVAPNTTSVSGGIYLSSGFHLITYRVGNNGTNGNAVLSYNGPDTNSATVRVGSIPNTVTNIGANALTVNFDNNISLAATTTATIDTAANTRLGTLTMTGTGAGTTLNLTSSAYIPSITFTGGISLSDNLTINNSTVNVPISGIISETAVAGLTKGGLGTMTLSGVNTYSGPTTMSQGTLSVSTIPNGGIASPLGMSSNAETNLVFNGGTLQYTGATATTDRTYSINAGTTGTFEITNAATNLTIPGATGAATTGLFGKSGLGTLSLTGLQTTTGNISVSAGTLNLSGGWTGLGGSTILAYGTTSGNAIVNVSAGDYSFFGTQGATSAGAVAVYNQTGGNVVVTTNTTTGNQCVARAVGSYGYMNLTGGTYRDSTGTSGGSRFTVSNAGGTASALNGTGNGVVTAVLYVGGTGFLDRTNGEWWLNYGLGQITVADSGKIDCTGSNNFFGIFMDSTVVGASYGVLNLAGPNAQVTLGAQPIRFGNSGTNDAGNNGFVNLAAGTLGVGANVTTNLPAAPSSINNAYFNFAGGKLQATATLSGWIPVSNASINFNSNIYGAIDNSAVAGAPSFSGGLTVETSGFNVTLANPLRAPAGAGVTQANLSITGGSGYIGAPAVIFSNAGVIAGGSPAAGYALISGGQVTGIVITAPGTYTPGTVPTITLIGGTSDTPATAMSSALNTSNTSGGLTKVDAGTLTLSGVNTYTAGTTITGGTLALGINNALASSGNVTINGGTFDIKTFTNTVGTVSLQSGAITGTTGVLTSTANYDLQSGDVSGILAGSVGAIKSTAGTVTIDSNNTFTGAVQVTGGILNFSALNNLGDSTNAGNTITLNGGTLRYTGTTPLDLGSNRVVTIGSSGGTINASSSVGVLNVSGGVAPSSGNLTKAGAGTVSITGAVNLSAAAGGGAVSVSNGTLIAGFGTSGIANLNVGATGTMSFNNSNIEVLTLGNSAGALTLADGAQINLELSSTNGVSDRINVGATGTAVTSGTITLNFFGSLPATGGHFDLITAPSGLSPASATSYVLGSAPNGFNYTINVSDTLVSIDATPLQVLYWRGGQDLSWNTLGAGVANWTTDSAGTVDSDHIPRYTPIAESVIFSATGAPTVTNTISTTLDNSFKINGLQFTNVPTGITSVTLSAGVGGALELSPISPSGGIKVLAGGGSVTLAADLALNVSADQTWLVDPSGSLTISGVTTFNASINKTDSGAVTLNGANSGTGTIKLTGGALNIGNASALGGGTFIIGAGAVINNTTGAPLTLSTNNVQNWNGDFTFTATNDLDLGTGAVTLGATSIVTVGTAGKSLTVNGAIGGSSGRGITLAGPGQLTLAGSTANTFDGPVIIAGSGAGTGHALVLNKSGVNAIAGTSLTIGDGSTASGSDAALRLLSNEQINDAAVLHFDGGLSNAKFELNGFNETIAGVTVDSGALAIIQNLETGGAGTSILTIKSNSIDSVFNGYLRNSTGVLGLTKDGTSKLTLTGANINYTGQTTIAGGTLELNTTAFNSPVNFTASSTGTLQILGTALTLPELSSADTTNLNNIVQNADGVSTTLTINQGTTTNFGGIVRDNPSSGILKLVKTGSGNLTLNSANSYSNGTTLNGGTLTFGAGQTLGGALIFGSAANSTTISTLDMTNSSTTFVGSALLAQTNNASSNSLVIGPGKTMTLNGNITLSCTVDGGTTAVTASGGGSLIVNGASILVGNDTAGANNSSKAILDLSGLNSFTATLSGNLAVQAAGDNNAADFARLLLSNGANSITSAAVLVGNSGTGSPNTLFLGTGTNTINTDLINLGNGSRDTGIIQFTGAGGSVVIRNRAGSGRVAQVNLGVQATQGTAYTTANLIDTTGHNADIAIDTFATSKGAKAANNTNDLKFDTGTLDVKTINMAVAKGTGPSINTITIGGGVVKFGGSATFGDAGAGTITLATAGSGELKINGGTVNSSVSFTKATGGTGTAILTLAGTGTLDMGGNSIGLATKLIDTLTFTSGTLQNVAEINNGAGLAKNTTGTFTLAGTNSYSGNTVITQGTLSVGSTSAIPNGIGKGNVVLDGGATSGALDLNGFDATINGLAGTTGTFVGQVTNNGAGTTKTLTVGNADASSMYEGNFLDGTGFLALAKTGTGTLTLTGTGVHSGSTTVSGGTLAGTASFSNSALIVSGGTVAPGIQGGAIGTFTAASANFSAGGKLKVRVSTASQSGADVLMLSGALTMGGTSSLEVDLTDFPTGTPASVYVAEAASWSVNAPFVNVIFTNKSTNTVSIGYENATHRVFVNLNGAVTPVKISQFSSTLESNGVMLSWTAVSEYKNAGFNLYRRAMSGSEWTLLNPALIGGRITNPDEKTYTYFDWAPTGEWMYRIESIDVAGGSEFHENFAGPVCMEWNSELIPSVEVNRESIRAVDNGFAVMAGVRNAESVGAAFAGMQKNVSAKTNSGVREFRPTSTALQQSIIAGVRGVASSPHANSSTNVMAGVRWFSSSNTAGNSSFTAAKVVYDKPGVMIIPQSQMPAGFNIERVSLQREGRNFSALAQVPAGLLVYAPGYQDEYTDKDVIFLRRTSAPTKVGSTSAGTGLFSSTTPVNVSTPAIVKNEYHDVYFDYSSAFRPFTFAPWFSSKYLSQGTTQDFVLSLPAATGGAAKLTVNVWSLTSSTTINPDHGLQLVINGQNIATSSWDGGERLVQVTFDIPSGVLNSGDNSVSLVTPTIAGLSTQIALLHSMTAEYTRQLDGSKPFEITNVSGQLELYELYNVPAAGTWVVDARYSDRAALVPTETLIQADGTLRLRFMASSGGTGRFVVTPVGQEYQPLSIKVRQVRAARLTGTYMSTGPAQFASGVQPLLLRRSKEGIKGSYVDQENLFDYYNFGRFGPNGIRNAVRSLKPKYLMLVGRTTYDYRNYEGQNIDPLCPAYLVSTHFWAQTTSDSMYGDLGRGYPEVAIGRLPVNNETELTGAVTRILSYKGVAYSGVRLHAVADEPDAKVADFGAQLDAMVKAYHSEMTWQENYLARTFQTSPEVTAAMKAAANGGADWILYSGHGNAARLGNHAPSILDQSSVQEWTGNTVFLQATCTANWMAKNVDDYRSIAIQAMTQPQGGISASIGTSTYMNPEVAAAFVNQLLKNTGTPNLRWGSALLNTQQWAGKQTGSPFYKDMMLTEQLFGDPAMPIYAPQSSGKSTGNGAAPAGTF